jgi:shikimate kinase
MAGGKAAAGCIVLIGPMGSGKSSVARELAGRTGWRWIDTDRLAAQQAGRSIPEIFATQGEECFRDLECAAVRTLAGLRPAIVATGGGVVLRAENIALLRSLGCVAWLTASEDVLFERISRTRKRPLLATADPRATMRALLTVRDPLYAACSHVKIDTSLLSHAEVADAVLALAPAQWSRTSPAAAAGGKLIP